MPDPEQAWDHAHLHSDQWGSRVLAGVEQEAGPRSPDPEGQSAETGWRQHANTHRLFYCEYVCV